MHVFDVSDPKELGLDSAVTRRFPKDQSIHRYSLRERSLLQERFSKPITRMATANIGDATISYVSERFATEATIEGTVQDRFCFTTMLSGRLASTAAGHEIVAEDRVGLAYRGQSGTRLLTSDGSVRLNLWLHAAKLERALAALLEENLRRPLQFHSTIDWGAGLALSLQGQLGLAMSELARPDGLTSAPVALASFNDLIAHLVLAGLPHNYSDRLRQDRTGALPFYINRAEDFMRANAATPLCLEQIASAAGCSVRTLSQVYRKFRSTTPLARLHALRLEYVRFELQQANDEKSAAAIARRFGFTNSNRFVAAYRQRFGENPLRTGRS